jgi:hypothetical protein
LGLSQATSETRKGAPTSLASEGSDMRQRPRTRIPHEIVRLPAPLRDCEVAILSRTRADLKARIDTLAGVLRVLEREQRAGRHPDLEIARWADRLQARLSSYTRSRSRPSPRMRARRKAST